MVAYNIDLLRKDILGRKPLVLFVGTGIHASKNLDLSWNGALDCLFRNALEYMCREKNIPTEVMDTIMGAMSLDNEHADVTDKDWQKLFTISAQRMSPMIMASIIKQVFKGNYLSELQYFLYKQNPAEMIRVEFEKNYSLGRENKNDAQFYTLYQLARLILLCPVVAVVSYNYDNLLTEAVNILKEDKDRYFTEGEKELLRDIELVEIQSIIDRKTTRPKTVSVYHPHGYIPPPQNVIKEPSGGIVLSMEEYYDNTKEVHSWQTATQEHFLCHYTCLLSGLSLNDITIQRMLRYADRFGNADRIYYLNAVSPSRLEKKKYKDAYKAMMGILTSFYASYGLTPVCHCEGFHRLYEDIGDIINAYCEKQTE